LRNPLLCLFFSTVERWPPIVFLVVYQQAPPVTSPSSCYTGRHGPPLYLKLPHVSQLGASAASTTPWPISRHSGLTHARGDKGREMDKHFKAGGNTGNRRDKIYYIFFDKGALLLKWFKQDPLPYTPSVLYLDIFYVYIRVNLYTIIL
jgi:hypothetical protein